MRMLSGNTCGGSFKLSVIRITEIPTSPATLTLSLINYFMTKLV